MPDTRACRISYSCSFCGKSQDQVARLIAGPGSVYVCDECVVTFRDALAGGDTGSMRVTASEQAAERCSFCGKKARQVRHLFPGPDGVRICNECVGLCMEIIEEEGATCRTARSAEAPTSARRHLLDLDDWTPDELRALLRSAAAMRERLDAGRQSSTLAGRVVVNLFYENSTRTRVSFELAAKKLGADVVNVTASASSVAKGESLRDTVRTLQALGASIVVVRSGQSGAPDLIARAIDGAVVNAGDGWHAHPSQALLDLFTLDRHLGALEGRRIVILGDILHSRVARSNVWSLTALGAEVVFCGPATLLPPAAAELYMVRPVPGSGAARRVIVEPRIERALAGADAIMALRIQKERMQAGLLPSLREYSRTYGLNAARLQLAKPGTLVLHPGPMNEGVEIAPDVATSAHSVIEEQVTNGVAVRMAVLQQLGAALNARCGGEGRG